jgi:hypothetical protein
VKDAVASDDAAKMKSTMEALQQEVIKMGQAMYQQPGAGGAPGAGGCLLGVGIGIHHKMSDWRWVVSSQISAARGSTGRV